jgi:hypothetical protein
MPGVDPRLITISVITALQSGGKNLSYFNASRRRSQFPLGSATGNPDD